MSNNLAIEVNNISKKYNISLGYEPDNIREKLVELFKYPINALKGTHKSKSKIFWALKNISFDLKKGEVLGVIGKNGAGKSTLLKILSRITDPTDGKILIRGRVASLLEVGTGFNPELTGRENIFLNGAIIGMSKYEILSKIDAIIDFSGVKEFIDTPVKRYSSGMYVRLAFAVAVHLDADILLLDEVLSVGDADFQKKSSEKMKEIVSSGRTIIFVSHSMQSISSICTKCIYIENGKVEMEGHPSDCIKAYYENSSNKRRIGKRIISIPNKKAYINTINSNFSKNTLNINVVIIANINISNLNLGLSIHDAIGRTIGITYSSPTAELKLHKGKNHINVKIIDFQITPGEYTVRARIESNMEELDWPREDLSLFNVPSLTNTIGMRPETYANGQYQLKTKWGN